MIKIILALLISISIQAQEIVNQPFSICDDQGHFQEKSLNLLSLTLSHQIIKSIENTTLIVLPNTGYPFNGSIDWHSSIHAHWALLSMARKLNQPQLKEYVLKRIKNEHLRKISQVIINKGKLAYQYALSWLLLLTHELDLTKPYLCLARFRKLSD